MRAKVRLSSLRFTNVNDMSRGLRYTRSRRESDRIRQRTAPTAGRPAKPTQQLDVADQIEAQVRRALARDLHDQVAQTLTTMIVEVENYKSEHAGQQRVVGQLHAVQDSARDVLSNLRQLVYELRGEEGIGGRFVDVIGSVLTRFETNTGIATELTVGSGWPTTLRNPAASNLRSLIEEALANARRHSGAHTISVLLDCTSSDRLTVTVSDDGNGIDSVSRVTGLGMTGMRERAILLGGRLRIEGTPGKGTTVRASFRRALLIATECSAG